MKYLFIVQGEGRGHLTQAMTMEKLLLARGHEVVEILVGKSQSRQVPGFFEEGVSSPVRYFETVNFVPSHKKKRPNPVVTFFYNIFMGFRFLPSIRLIRKSIKHSGADVVVNFYEMLGSLAHFPIRKKVPMVCVGHQFLFLHKDFRLPEYGYEGHLALNLFSAAIARNASKILALSFREMPDDPSRRIKVVPPLLRPELIAFRSATGENDSPDFRSGDYILGYMLNAGFAEEVEKWHAMHPEVPLHFFWDNREAGPVKKVDETLTFYYLDDKEFLRQMAGCKAYAATAGFESICEAMYLGKPLMMVPSHIEQKCNAYDATMYGAAVASHRFDLSILEDFASGSFRPDLAFPQWARSAQEVFIRELESVEVQSRAVPRR